MPAVDPPDNAVTRPFWDGIRAGELRLPRCRRRGGWQWYPIPGVGHACGGELEWTPVAPVGTIFSHTTVRRPFLPGAGNDDVPLVTVLVELDDAPGVRLVGRSTDPAPTIGRRVVARFEDRHGNADLWFVAADAAAADPTSTT